jgi:choline dehydrogenase-like flavoprotein
MPTVTTGNTNAPAIMIGERAADFLSSERPARVTAAAGTA